MRYRWTRRADGPKVRGSTRTTPVQAAGYMSGMVQGGQAGTATAKRAMAVSGLRQGVHMYASISSHGAVLERPICLDQRLDCCGGSGMTLESNRRPLGDDMRGFGSLVDQADLAWRKGLRMADSYEAGGPPPVRMAIDYSGPICFDPACAWWIRSQGLVDLENVCRCCRRPKRPVKTSECPCGINRTMCEYHREA
jgi:hypothetical protein